MLLAIATVMFWPRGKQDRWQARRPQCRPLAVWFRVEIRYGFLCYLSFLPSAGSGLWHNTEVLNLLPGPKDMGRVQAAYEKTYKPLDKLPQPGVRSVSLRDRQFPGRNVNIRGEEVTYNPYSHPLDEIHFLNRYHHFPDRESPSLYDTSIDVPGAVLARDDTRMSYRIYRFTPHPLQPGEERTPCALTVKSKNRGFENKREQYRSRPERHVPQQPDFTRYRLQLLTPAK